MSIVRHLMWNVFNRAADVPRVQQIALKTVVTVDKTLSETADKVVEFAAEKDPVREAGRMVGKLMSGGNDKN